MIWSLYKFGWLVVWMGGEGFFSLESNEIVVLYFIGCDILGGVN